MRKTLIAAVALVAMAAAFAAVAAGGTHSTAQRVRIEVAGTDPFTFVLKPTARGRVQADRGEATFCCWRSWTVTRAGAKLEVSNPRLVLAGEQGRQGTLTIREQIEWVALPDGWSVCTGTWKVIPGTSTGPYAGLSGHGRVACAWAPETGADRALRVRLFGFLEPK
jgi:hypothetical protein